MSFGRKNEGQEPVRHRRPATTPPAAADEAVLHAKLAGAAALRAIPEAQVPWKKIRRYLINAALAIAVLGGGSILVQRHVAADTASRGYASTISQLSVQCKRLNSELAMDTPLNCSDLFNDAVAEKMGASEYWIRFAGFDPAPDVRQSFIRAKGMIQARSRRLAEGVRLRVAEEPVLLVSAAHEPSFDMAAMCRRKWPDNYRMEAYCMNKQEEARSWVKGRSTEPRIAKHCMKSWSEDWNMFQYCIRQEEKARDGLRR